MSIVAELTYTPRKWKLAGLTGISDHTLEVHFGLYEGYVKNVNLLNEQLDDLVTKGQDAPTNLSFSELSRHLGFEYNGMVLHEYYFDNLKASAGGPPAAAPSATPSRGASADSKRGRRTSPPSAGCAASAGPSPIRIHIRAGYRITG